VDTAQAHDHVHHQHGDDDHDHAVLHDGEPQGAPGSTVAGHLTSADTTCTFPCEHSRDVTGLHEHDSGLKLFASRVPATGTVAAPTRWDVRAPVNLHLRVANRLDRPPRQG
jgi:hypothetical protein